MSQISNANIESFWTNSTTSRTQEDGGDSVLFFEMSDIPPFYVFTQLTIATIGTALCLSSFITLFIWRKHRAVRAAGVELSACVLGSAALRILTVLMTALPNRATPLVCVFGVAPSALASCLTFTAIALKVSSLFLANSKPKTCFGWLYSYSYIYII